MPLTSGNVFGPTGGATAESLALFDGTTGKLLKQLAAVVYNSAYTGGAGGDPAHAALVFTDNGINVNYTQTLATCAMPVVGIRATCNPVADQAVGDVDNLSAIQPRAIVPSTATKRVGNITGADCYATYAGQGNFTGVTGADAIASIDSSTAITGTSALGLFAGSWTTNANVTMSYVRPIYINNTANGVITLRGTIDTYEAISIENFAAGSATINKRRALYIGTMSGTATLDNSIYVDATQPSVFRCPVSIGIAGTATGFLALSGSTSGTVTARVNNTAGTWTWEWPASAGTDGFFLKTNGSGVSSWAQVPVCITGSAGGNTVASSTTTYGCVSGLNNSLSTTESIRNWVAPMAGTIKNFYLNTLNTQSGTGSMVVKLRKGTGVGALSDTTVTVTIAANDVSQQYADTTHSFTVAAGDVVSIQFVNNATATSCSLGAWGVQLVP